MFELVDRMTASAWTPLALLALVCGLIIVVLVIALGTRKSKKIESLYQTRLHLFTPAERLFHQALRTAVGADYQIYGKLRLTDIVEPKQGLSKPRRTRALDQMAGLYLDFALVRPDSLNVACVIALDDATPARRGRIQPDTFIDDVLSYTGIPCARFRAQPVYASAEIRDELAAVMHPAGAANEPRLVR